MTIEVDEMVEHFMPYLDDEMYTAVSECISPREALDLVVLDLGHAVARCIERMRQDVINGRWDRDGSDYNYDEETGTWVAKEWY